MSECYRADCLVRVNYTCNPQNCEHTICKERIGLNTSCVPKEEMRFREALQRNPFSFRMQTETELSPQQKVSDRYDPMEYIWSRRKKWAVKFQCNTDGSTIVFGYVCPKCMAESDEPLDNCPRCGADLREG